MSATMVWSEQDLDDHTDDDHTDDDDDQLNVQQHHPGQAPLPFEISAKAKKILGLGYDSFPINVPALRLTASTPERRGSTSTDMSARTRHARIARYEMHLAQQPRRPRFVGKPLKAPDATGAKKLLSPFEFPARHEKERASPDAPSRHNQSRAINLSQHGRASLDLPPRNTPPRIQQPSQRSISLAAPPKTGAFLDVPQRRTVPKEQRPSRTRYYKEHPRQERASLDAPRPSVPSGPVRKPARSASFAAYDNVSSTGLSTRTSVKAASDGQAPATRRGNSNSFPNFSRPLSQPPELGDDVGKGRPSLEISRVQTGEILRPKKIGAEDGELQRDTSQSQKIPMVGDEKVPQSKPPVQETASVKSPVDERNPQQDTPLSPQKTGDIDGHLVQTLSSPTAASSPDDEVDRKPSTKPLLTKLFTSLPRRVIQTGNKSLAVVKGHNSESRSGNAYSRHLSIEEKLRQLEEDVDSVPKMYLVLRNAPTHPQHNSRKSIDRLFMPTALLAPDPITPSISQRPGTSTSPSKSDLVLKALPALPPKTPQQSPLDKQHIALPPELPERVVISRARQVCHVCKEEKHIAHFSTWAPTTKCVHPPQTCLGCIQQCIATCIKTKGWDQCKCPECGLSLSHEDIKLFATQETFARYDHLSTRATLSNLPNFHWCQSPTCSSGQFHDERALNNLTFACESCGHMHCLNHHPTASYHAGETCIQYEARIASPCTPSVPPPSSQKHAEETADQQQYIIPCPNDTCSWFIENSEGCDKITCWKCKLEFCWECRAPFEPISRTGNSRLHNEGCKYWA